MARMSGQNVAVPVQSLLSNELNTVPAPPLPIAAESGKAISATRRTGKITGAKNVAAFVATKIVPDLPGEGGNVQDILAVITASSASRSQGSPLTEDTATTMNWDFDFSTMFQTEPVIDPATNIGVANVSLPAGGALDFSTFQQGYPSVSSAPHVKSGLDAFLSTLDVAPGWNLQNETVFKFDTSTEEFDDIGGTSIYDNDKDGFNAGNDGSHEVVGLDFSLVSAPPSSDGLHNQASSTSTPLSGNFNAVRSNLNVDSLLSSMSLPSWSSLSATAMATVIPSVITEARDRSPERQEGRLLGDQGQIENIQKEPASTDQENVKHSKNAVPSDELGEPEGDERPVRQCKVTQRPDGPVWRQRTETELLSDDLGDNWHSCIEHWLAFEGMPTTYDVRISMSKVVSDT